MAFHWLPVMHLWSLDTLGGFDTYFERRRSMEGTGAAQVHEGESNVVAHGHDDLQIELSYHEFD
jgi:hypothetical protein